MADTIEAIIAFANREDGRVVAASTAEPYFCFEAADEEEAKRKVEEALAFYIEAKREIRRSKRPSTETRITVSRIRPYSRHKRELAVA